MRYYILFTEKVDGKRLYFVCSSGTKTQALSKVKDYRNDGIVYGPNDLSFTLEDVINGRNNYIEVGIPELKEQYCNTRVNFKLSKPNGEVSYFTGREDELVAHLKGLDKRGQFFTIGKDRFFVVREKKQNIPLYSIEKVKTIPLQLT